MTEIPPIAPLKYNDHKAPFYSSPADIKASGVSLEYRHIHRIDFQERFVINTTYVEMKECHQISLLIFASQMYF